MKLIKGFVRQKLNDKTIAVPTGELYKSFNGMIELNETAAYIWELLGEDTTLEAIAEGLSDKYGIPYEKALADAGKTVKQFEKAGILE